MHVEVAGIDHRIGVAPQERLAELERHPDLVGTRDDLCVELCALYNLVDQPERALQLLLERRFQPWEGGEGKVTSQFVINQLLRFPAARHDDAVDACSLFGRFIHKTWKAVEPAKEPAVDFARMPTIGEMMQPRPSREGAL